MARIRSVCVFCGSSDGARPEFAEAVRDVAESIVRRGWTIVYGGGRVGLMGLLADTALAAGGQVVGVIPGMLVEREVGHAGLTELHVVRTMAERKALMGERSDAFLTLPGGIGTLDELSEAWTWTQLGLQRKPSALLNVAGYFDALLQFLDEAVVQGFLPVRHRRLLLDDTNTERLLGQLESWEPPLE
ncbi:MAG TPA: TIGR00730 family Rossman fold protein [Steroidobacteraceae bacterium]|nr:TIGR00730 family Rossman fold protein [Steroidobacteraceae bacterium]